MGTLLFEDYMKPNIGHIKEATKILSLTIGQISRCRYNISNHICKVNILLDNQERMVLLTDSISVIDFLGQISVAKGGFNEASLDILFNWCNAHLKEGNLLTVLRDYQIKYYLPGIKYNNEIFYKLYSKDKFTTDLREHYGASWIDYEEQLEKSPFIYDTWGISGLWAFSRDTFIRKVITEFNDENHKIINDTCKKNYGSQLFLLKTIPSCKYFYNGKEIIGDRFNVIKKYDLTSNKDSIRLFKKLRSK